MTKLQYTFKTDTLFKILFVNHPDLLKRLVSELLEIEYDSIEQFKITNPEIHPEALGGKFCRLDVNMIVDGQRVVLEIQVDNEKNFKERSLYYWAREFSSTIVSGDDYSKLPRTIVICIVNFKLFKCKEFHSGFQALEVERHTQLTDKMSLHYFELPKLPRKLNANSDRDLWLQLFKANTQEELAKIEELEVPVMSEAIKAYESIIATSPDFKEIERLRHKASHDEAQALSNLEQRVNKKWLKVVKQKDTTIADKDAEITSKDAEIADKDAEITSKDAEIAALKSELVKAALEAKLKD